MFKRMHNYQDLQLHVDNKLRSLASNLVNNHHCHVYRSNLTYIYDNLTQITIVDLRHRTHMIVTLQYNPVRYELSLQQHESPDAVVFTVYDIEEDDSLLIDYIIKNMSPIPHNSSIHYLQHSVTTIEG